MTVLMRRKLLQFVVPVASVGLALVGTWSTPALMNRSSLFLFLAAVMISTWYGGLFSGLLATLIAAAVTAKFVLPLQAGHAATGGSDQLMRWVLFVLIALMISSLHASRGKAESALRRSEQRLMLAIDSAHMGVWDYNLLSRDFWWSKTLENIYGRTDGNFPRTYGGFFGCIHFDDQPLFNRAITRTIDEGTDYEIEHRVLLPDGSVRWVNTRGRVFFNESSRAERIVGVTTDITGRSKVELERQQLDERQELRQKPLSPVA
jgi:PAS domain S-box-containing protein